MEEINTNNNILKMKFRSRVKEVKRVNQTFSEYDVKNETMLFSADYDFARRNGDGLTNLFLDNIPEDWKQSDIIIDSRVHMLMKGWSPCIPGWHHDDVPRLREETHVRMKGQPNYENPEYYSEHLLFLINAGIAPTEFINEDVDVKVPEKYSGFS
jgi:hypothetical protein